MRKILTLAATAATLMGIGVTQVHAAGTTTANIAVNVTLQNNCLFTGGTVAATYLPGGNAVTSTNATALSVACSPGAITPSVSFGPGLTGTIAQRLATNGGNSLQYNLWTAATGGTILGNGTTGTTVTVAGSTIAAPKNVSVTLIVPDSATNQALPAGLYTDTVVATLTF